jgi:hypothetical protein
VMVLVQAPGPDSHCAAVGSECSRKKRTISLAASGPRGSV